MSRSTAIGAHTPESPDHPRGRSTPDVPRPVTWVTGPAAAILTELHDRPAGATVVALALAVEVSRSTTSKALTALEDRGLAWRSSGGNDRVRRLPDTWYLADPNHPESPAAEPNRTKPDPVQPRPRQAPAPCPQAPHPADRRDSEVISAESTPREQQALLEATSGSTAREPDEPGAEAVDASPSDVDAVRVAVEPGVGTAAAEPEMPGGADRADGGGLPPVSGEVPLDTGVCPTCGHPRRQPTPGAAMAYGSRLGQGQLHQRALDHLLAHPDEEWTATGIAKAIGRSSGAIANALVTMVKRGQAEQTSGSPKHYRAVAPLAGAAPHRRPAAVRGAITRSAP